jgi:hypothetical protein
LTNRIRLVSVALVSVTAFAAGGTLAGAAGAATRAGLSTIQAKAAAAITLRVNDLNAATSKVNGANGLGAGAPSLATYLQQDIPGLQQLGHTIAADTTVTAAETDAGTILANYRVLALVLPAVRLAGESDHIVKTTVPKLTALSAQAAKYEKTANQATIGPLRSDLTTQISAATNATSGLADTVLGYTPAQWNANNSLLSPSRSAVAGALSDIKKAGTDVQRIRADLKGDHAGKGAGEGATS